MSSQESTPETTQDKDEINFSDLLKNNDEAQEYMSICVLTKTIEDPDKLDDYQKAEWVAAFYSWIKAGKPQPTMPSAEKVRVSYPVTYYRLQYKGKDMMYYMDNLGDFNGMKEIKRYAEQKHPVTGKVVNSNVSVGKIKTYNMKFIPDTFNKLLAESTKLIPPDAKIRTYIMIGGSVYGVTAKEFATPKWEKLIDKFINVKRGD